MDNTMCRIESAIQSIEASVKRQEKQLEAIFQGIMLLNKMLALKEGLNSKTAEYLAKNNGQTDPESRDTSTNNSPFGSPFYHLSKNAQMIQEAFQQFQASNGGNKSSQEEEEEPKSNEDIKASFQRNMNKITALTERDCANDFATSASEKSDSDTKGHEQ